MTLYISKIELTNIRCFANLVIEPGRRGKDVAWTVLLGDNATGKTSLLRSIALGLCDESSAAALLKESDEGIIRRGETEGMIKLQMVDTNNLRRRPSIITRIKSFKDGRSNFERIRQTNYPSKDFPTDDIFVCAYGAGRGTSGAGDVLGYSPLNATYNLFNYAEGLQNPELTLLRMKKGMSNKGFRVIEKILPNLKRNAIKLSKQGITVTSSSWGNDMPFKDLADGFKSSLLWITDLLGWALIRNPGLKNLHDISGIVLIDEIDQHLHPSWQKTIVNDLRVAFPKVQFISTTHSESIARSIGGPMSEGIQSQDILYLLESDENAKQVVGRSIGPITGLSADQALTSEAFRLQTSTTDKVNEWATMFIKLARKADRTVKEEANYQALRAYLSNDQFQPGKDEIERGLKSELIKYLNKTIPESFSS